LTGIQIIPQGKGYKKEKPQRDSQPPDTRPQADGKKQKKGDRIDDKGRRQGLQKGIQDRQDKGPFFMKGEGITRFFNRYHDRVTAKTPRMLQEFSFFGKFFYKIRIN
jgi:hypothetical protein